MTDPTRALLLQRLKERLERAFRDAQRLHLCAVADRIMVAREELRRQAKERMGIETEGDMSNAPTSDAEKDKAAEAMYRGPPLVTAKIEGRP